MQDSQLEERAWALIQLKRWAEADELLSLALQQDVENVRAWAYKVICRAYEGKIAQARAIIGEALEVSPNGSYLHYLRAWVEARDNDHAAALNHLRQALALSPENADYFAFEAVQWLAIRKAARAEECGQRALEIEPQHTVALAVLAAAQRNQKRYTEALETARHGLAIAPENAILHREVGRSLLALDQSEEAASAFVESLRLVPGSSTSLRGLVDAANRQNGITSLITKYVQEFNNPDEVYPSGMALRATSFLFFPLFVFSLLIPSQLTLSLAFLALLVFAVALLPSAAYKPLSSLLLMRHPVACHVVGGAARTLGILIWGGLVLFCVLGGISVLLLNENLQLIGYGVAFTTIAIGIAQNGRLSALITFLPWMVGIYCLTKVILIGPELLRQPPNGANEAVAPAVMLVASIPIFFSAIHFYVVHSRLGVSEASLPLSHTD